MSAKEGVNVKVEEQLELLLRGTQFADEIDDRAGIAVPLVAAGEGEGGRTLRQQMTEELRQRLKEGRPLRVYLGADPTSTSLHIGHFVSVQKLRVFQELGHQVIFLMGDYTATIGDPTGQVSERRRLTHAEVMELSIDYQRQVFRLLDPAKTEVRFNGEWLAKLNFAQIAELAAIFPLKWVVSRRDFADRLARGESLRLHETLYCLMQGYDAYALDCDVQVGGYDQYLNMLAGRWIQDHFGQKPHICWTFPLLMGTDGRKMSKSFGNSINIQDSPEDMYGKTMRVADEMLSSYIDLATNFTPAQSDALKARLRAPGANPMEVKKEIAANLVTQYYGEDGSRAAGEHFVRVVQEKAAPDEIPEVKAPVALRSGKTWPDLLVALTFEGEPLAASKGEARRLMAQGGFYVEQSAVTDGAVVVEIVPGTTIRLGKRRYFRLVF